MSHSSQQERSTLRKKLRVISKGLSTTAFYVRPYRGFRSITTWRRSQRLNRKLRAKIILIITAVVMAIILFLSYTKGSILTVNGMRWWHTNIPKNKIDSNLVWVIERYLSPHQTQLSKFVETPRDLRRTLYVTAPLVLETSGYHSQISARVFTVYLRFLSFAVNRWW